MRGYVMHDAGDGQDRGHESRAADTCAHQLGARFLTVPRITRAPAEQRRTDSLTLGGRVAASDMPNGGGLSADAERGHSGRGRREPIRAAERGGGVGHDGPIDRARPMASGMLRALAWGPVGQRTTADSAVVR